MFTGYRRFRVPFFALRVSQGKQGSAQPLAAAAASLIEKETLPLVSYVRGVNEKMNIEH
jgi:hypothetical protein